MIVEVEERENGTETVVPRVAMPAAKTMIDLRDETEISLRIDVAAEVAGEVTVAIAMVDSAAAKVVTGRRAQLHHQRKKNPLQI